MIDQTLVVRKVNLIQSELEHLTAYAEFSFDEIAQDYTRQAVTERILERIINRAIDVNQHIIAETDSPAITVPRGYRDTFTTLGILKIFPQDFAESIAKSIGTRNKLVHEYDTIDERQIYDSIKDCLTDYTKYCEYILEFLKAPAEKGS